MASHIRCSFRAYIDFWRNLSQSYKAFSLGWHYNLVLKRPLHSSTNIPPVDGSKHGKTDEFCEHGSLLYFFAVMCGPCSGAMPSGTPWSWVSCYGSLLCELCSCGRSPEAGKANPHEEGVSILVREKYHSCPAEQGRLL